ncbi:hypothetical protein TUM17573_54650 [Klebsiella pneumoniae]|nr:hypothetical protein TUM17573_54650 [Klebsiella pneumoniae]
MMSLWDALRMNMMISYQELVRTFLKGTVTALKLRWDGALQLARQIAAKTIEGDA